MRGRAWAVRLALLVAIAVLIWWLIRPLVSHLALARGLVPWASQAVHLGLSFLAGLLAALAAETLKDTWTGRAILGALRLDVGLGRHKCDTAVLGKLAGLGVTISGARTADLARGGWVYWPVTIDAGRQFNNIHKAQCVVLKRLKASGFRIALYMFDDRRAAHDQSPSEIAATCERFRGRAKDFLEFDFDDHVRTSELWSSRRSHWQLRRYLEEVLRERTVDDFLQFAQKGDPDISKVLGWLMWHLIEPAMSLAFLRHFCVSRKAAVITLSGADEEPMWTRLMDCPTARNLDVSHAFIPQLNEPPGAADGKPARRASRKWVTWNTDQEIGKVVQQYDYPPARGDTGNMFDWLVRHFVCIGGICQLGPWKCATPEELYGQTSEGEKQAVVSSVVHDLAHLLRG
jgi:hypothetical protein